MFSWPIQINKNATRILCPRLHRHANFGDMLVSDMCRTLELVQLAGLWCPTRRTLVSKQCLLFFFFSSLFRHVWHANSEKRKENHRLKVKLTFQVLNPPLPLTAAGCRCPLSLTRARLVRSASSIDVDTMSYPFRSLSLGVDNKSDSPLLFSLSLFVCLFCFVCFFFCFFFFFQIFWWMGLLLLISYNL